MQIVLSFYIVSWDNCKVKSEPANSRFYKFMISEIESTVLAAQNCLIKKLYLYF